MDVDADAWEGGNGATKGWKGNDGSISSTCCVAHPSQARRKKDLDVSAAPTPEKGEEESRHSSKDAPCWALC